MAFASRDAAFIAANLERHRPTRCAIQRFDWIFVLHGAFVSGAFYGCFARFIASLGGDWVERGVEHWRNSVELSRRSARRSTGESNGNCGRVVIYQRGGHRGRHVFRLGISLFPARDQAATLKFQRKKGKKQKCFFPFIFCGFGLDSTKNEAVNRCSLHFLWKAHSFFFGTFPAIAVDEQIGVGHVFCPMRHQKSEMKCALPILFQRQKRPVDAPFAR